MLAHDALLITAIRVQFQPRVVASLDSDDDANLWSTAVGQIIADAEFLCRNGRAGQMVFTEIGRCSHWWRPHQSRWLADGGFTLPTGYGASGYSYRRLPEFDWLFVWQWTTDDNKWQLIEKPSGKRCLQLRIAIPSRTTRHDQAAVHTVWSPGTPTTPKKKLVQYYGFRKHDDAWELTAHQCTNVRAYDLESPD